MPREDRIRLQHIVEAAQQAQKFVEGRRREDLETDRQLLFALVRCIEIIGEAGSKVSPSTQSQHPEVPWPQMSAMRNRLIHAYFDVNTQLIWDTVADDLPPLIEQLQTILSKG